jgi:hypothetical protein
MHVQQKKGITDEQLIKAVSAYFAAQESFPLSGLITFIGDRAPLMLNTPPPFPFWLNPFFTSEDRVLMLELTKEEIRDCLEETACDILNNQGAAETFALVLDDPEDYAEFLRYFDSRHIDRVGGEFVRANDEDEEYAPLIDRGVQLKLIDQQENNLTPEGYLFRDAYKKREE